MINFYGGQKGENYVVSQIFANSHLPHSLLSQSHIQQGIIYLPQFGHF